MIDKHQIVKVSSSKHSRSNKLNTHSPDCIYTASFSKLVLERNLKMVKLNTFILYKIIT